MRILHVHSGNLFGGVERVLRCFALFHGSEQHEFAFAFDGRIARELGALGARVHNLGEARALDPFSVRRARHALTAIARWGRFDAAVMHSPWALGLFGPAAVRPIVFYQHDVLNGSHWTERIARRAAPDLIVANSAFTARSTPRAFSGQGAVVVHPPADLPERSISSDERNSLRARLRTAPTETAILIAARFEPWKGHCLLMDALAHLRDNPRWVLWVAGHAQRPHELRVRDEFMRIAVQAGIASRVRLLGHVADIPALMQASDIYCQPNTQPEAFGLTFIEALHARVPVVATRLGGAEEIITPGAGYLLPPDASAIAVALETLILEPARRRDTGVNGHMRALELCDARRQVARFCDSIAVLRQVRAA